MQPILRIATQAVRSASRELIARAPQSPSSRAISAASEAYFQRSHDRAFREIARNIERSYPDHQVILSENFHADSDVETQWIVEPISGRVNFMRRLDNFCTVLAIARNGRLRHGLVIDHFRDGEYNVSISEGCFSNDGRIRVSETRTTAGALIAHSDMEDQLRFPSAELRMRSSGCFGLDLAYTASGRFDALAFGTASNFHFHVARLFIKEAGGFTTTIQGGEWLHETDGLISGNLHLQRKLVAAARRNADAAVQLSAVD